MAKKKNTKTKTKTKEEESPELLPGEQFPLMDVAPENYKDILHHTKRYKAAQTRRIKALDEEKAEKRKVLELVENAKLQRLADGSIKFRCEGYQITVKPRDELIQIKEDEAA